MDIQKMEAALQKKADKLLVDEQKLNPSQVLGHIQFEETRTDKNASDLRKHELELKKHENDAEMRQKEFDLDAEMRRAEHDLKVKQAELDHELELKKLESAEKIAHWKSMGDVAAAKADDRANILGFAGKAVLAAASLLGTIMVVNSDDTKVFSRQAMDASTRLKDGLKHL